MLNTMIKKLEVNNLKAKNSNLKAFTLGELLVAMSLFTILVSIAAGGFVKAMKTQRTLTALMAANDNVSLVVEQIAREMRTGYRFCTESSPLRISDDPEREEECRSLASNEIMFVNSKNETVFYKIENGFIRRAVSSIFPERGNNYKEITGNNVSIKDFRINLMGNQPNDNLPPRITIFFSVAPRGPNLEDITTNIQTTISSRVPEDQIQ